MAKNTIDRDPLCRSLPLIYKISLCLGQRQSLWPKILLTETVSLAKNTIDRDPLFSCVCVYNSISWKMSEKLVPYSYPLYIHKFFQNIRSALCEEETFSVFAMRNKKRTEHKDFASSMCRDYCLQTFLSQKETTKCRRLILVCHACRVSRMELPHCPTLIPCPLQYCPSPPGPSAANYDSSL